MGRTEQEDCQAALGVINACLLAELMNNSVIELLKLALYERKFVA